MKKFIAVLFIASVLTATALSAKTMTVKLVAYVPEKVSVQMVGDQVVANSNNSDTRVVFTDASGSVTSSKNAQVLNVIAA